MEESIISQDKLINIPRNTRIVYCLRSVHNNVHNCKLRLWQTQSSLNFITSALHWLSISLPVPHRASIRFFLREYLMQPRRMSFYSSVMIIRRCMHACACDIFSGCDELNKTIKKHWITIRQQNVWAELIEC